MRRPPQFTGKLGRVQRHDWLASLTFEEDELALAVLVRGVDLCRQASPEHADEHGVARHDRVVPHSPKPVVLKEGVSDR